MNSNKAELRGSVGDSSIEPQGSTQENAGAGSLRLKRLCELARIRKSMRWEHITRTKDYDELSRSPYPLP
jgi:hypothetical protein